MKETLRTILSETATFARGLSGVYSPNNIVPNHSAAKVTGGLFAAAFNTLAIGAFVVTETGLAILAEVRRRRRLRASHPESPSLRGTPTDKEIASDCEQKPRTLLVRLRLGSRLADLAPTLDTDPHYDISPTGARRIASRGPGLKGWLADHRITTNYSTLAKYRLLVTRLRLLLQLDERLPLEWLLPGAAPDHPLPLDLRNPCFTARRRLRTLLRAHRNFSRLRKHVDAALGIPQLLRVRRETRRAKQVATERRWMAKHVPIHCESVVLGDRSVILYPPLVESTKREILLFLRTPDLPPKLDRLRNRAIDWICTHASSSSSENRAGLHSIGTIESRQ